MVAKKILVVLLCVSAVAFAQDDKRVYLGIRAGVGVGLSALSADYENSITRYGGSVTRGGASFDVAPFVSVQLADVFALQTELLFTKFGVGSKESGTDYDEYTGRRIPWEEEEKYSRSAMIIPVLAKFTFRPENLAISVFFGPHFTVNMGKWKETEIEVEDGIEYKYETKYTDAEFWGMGVNPKYPPVGLTAGFSFGFNAGPGYIFFDARYLTDLGFVKQEYYDDYNYNFPRLVEEDYFRRSKLSFTVGYEFGAGER